MEQLSRNFWVKRTEIVAAGYDLTASRYRQVAQDEAFYEQPGVTLKRLLELDTAVEKEIEELQRLLR
jgi:type I restriction enzyme M protein